MNTNFMLQGATKLSKSEMKSVKGGAGTCKAIDADGRIWNGTKETIMYYYDEYNFQRWCCDSCDQATWLK